jgi:hypothetical protein
MCPDASREIVNHVQPLGYVALVAGQCMLWVGQSVALIDLGGTRSDDVELSRWWASWYHMRGERYSFRFVQAPRDGQRSKRGGREGHDVEMDSREECMWRES